jgi:tRNA1(Val) A37 N6-methylase TrmN6
MTDTTTDTDTTEDAVLGGRLRLRQPRRGHRVGHDAILLAAATAARAGDHLVDLGAGVGAAGLAVAARVPDARVTLVERDPALAALAAGNAARNGFADRVRAVVLDVTAAAPHFTAAGLAAGSANRVLMNPPFNDPLRHRASPDRGRSDAHVAAPAALAQWVRAAARLLASGGVLTAMWRADGLPELLAALEGDFGGVAVLPVHPRPHAPAIRVIVHAVKGSRARLRLLPGLVMAEADGAPAAAAEAVLRDAGVLALAEP